MTSYILASVTANLAFLGLFPIARMVDNFYEKRSHIRERTLRNTAAFIFLETFALFFGWLAWVFHYPVATKKGLEVRYFDAEVAEAILVIFGGLLLLDAVLWLIARLMKDRRETRREREVFKQINEALFGPGFPKELGERAAGEVPMPRLALSRISDDF